MEVHLVRGDAVHLRLGGGEQCERAGRGRRDGRREAVQQLAYLAAACDAAGSAPGVITWTRVAASPARVIGSVTSSIGSPRQAISACSSPSGTPASTSAPSSMSPLTPLDRSSQPIIGWLPLWRAIRAANTPAPKPLSMLQTATPGAHEFSIPSSAARPPKLAP